MKEKKYFILKSAALILGLVLIFAAAVNIFADTSATTDASSEISQETSDETGNETDSQSDDETEVISQSAQEGETCGDTEADFLEDGEANDSVSEGDVKKAGEIYDAFESVSSDTDRKARIINPEAEYAQTGIMPMSATGTTINLQVTEYRDYPNGIAGTDNYGVWKATEGNSTYIAACLNASKPGKQGVFTVQETDNEALKACLLMLPGNPLYQKAVETGDIKNIFGSLSEEYIYMYIHIASSVIYSGDYGTSGSSDPNWTADDYTYINQVVSFCGAIAANGGYLGISLSDYTLFTAYTGANTQTIGWVEGRPARDDLRITVNKKDTNGNPVAGAQFTVYGYSSSTGGYTAAVDTKTTDKNGRIVFSDLTDGSDLPKTANGLFLVRETGIPEGYEASAGYFNSYDQSDFEKFGGRLYYVPATGGDCPAYRDTDSITVIQEKNDDGIQLRLVFDHTGYFVSDVWSAAQKTGVETCWWTEDSAGSHTTLQSWHDDTQMSGGSKVWYRSFVSAETYMKFNGANYSVSSLNAHTYSSNRTNFIGKTSGSASGNVYGGNGGPDWTSDVTNGRFELYNYRRGDHTYLFRAVNTSSSSLTVTLSVWTDDGDTSDKITKQARVAAGGYTDIICEVGELDNLSLLKAAVNIGGAETVIQPVKTCEYKASVFINEKTEGYVYVRKISSVPGITDKNHCYSLSGAVYGIYTDPDCTDKAATLTTGLNGQSQTVKMDQGTYYIKEITASKGYQLDTKVYTVSISAENTEDNPAYIESKEIPLSVPASVRITKLWDGEKTQTLPLPEGTQFTFTFYGGMYDSVEEAENAVKNGEAEKREWIFESKYDEESGGCAALFDDAHKVSGDDFYIMDGKAALPYGTLVIEETKAAPGYTLSGTFKDAEGNVIASSDDDSRGFVYITHISDTKSGISVSGEYTSYDSPVRGRIKVIKYESDGKTPIQGAEFRLTASDGREAGVIKTGSNGEAVFDGLYPDVYTLTETAAPEGHTLLKDPVEIRLPMTLSAEEAQDAKLDVSEDGVIYVPGKSDANGETAEGYYLIMDQTYEIKNTPVFAMPQSGSSGTPEIIYLSAGLTGAAAVFVISGKRRNNR